MVVIPVDSDINEAQDIAEKNGKTWPQGREIRSMRRPHLQHHNGDDDGNNPVTKGFHAALGNFLSSLRGLSSQSQQARHHRLEKRLRGHQTCGTSLVQPGSPWTADVSIDIDSMYA